MAKVFVETLEKEISPCGIHAMIFESGGFRSARGGEEGQRSGEKHWFPEIPEYQAGFSALMREFAADFLPSIPNETEKLSGAIIDVVRGEGPAEGRGWPVRVCLGPDAAALVRQKCTEQLRLCDEWDDVAGMVVKDGWSGQVSQFMLKTCSMLRTGG